MLHITVKIKPASGKFPHDDFRNFVSDQLGHYEGYYEDCDSVEEGVHCFYGEKVAGIQEMFTNLRNDSFRYTFTVTTKPISDKAWKKLARENEFDLD